jgi:phage terminase large subunit-like protein
VSLSTVAEYAARQFEAQTITLGRPPLEPHQRPPAELTDRSKNFWLLEGGRGCGKTEACARYFSAYMRDNPGVRGRIIAPSNGDAIESCINGPSGLLAIDDQVKFYPSAPGGSKVKWPNGSEALLLGTYKPNDVDRLRASGNRHLDWWEEMAANRQLEDAWQQAAFGLRLGYFPHSIASTTPKTTPAYRKIRALDECIRVHATMYDNPYSSPEWRRRIEKDWGGTRVGRQEIHGILLEDVEGALWTLELLAHVTLAKPLPDLTRIVTSYDPSGSEDGDATGIITLGRDTAQVIYVLGDDTTGGTPEHRAETACLAAARHGADEILWESNYGGDQIKAVLRSAWEHLVRTGKLEGPPPRLTANDAKGSKAQRAEPIAGLYEQHAAGTERVWHAQAFPQLVDELTTWEVDSDWSPNRLDALVHGARHLTRRIGRRRESDRAQRAAETLRSSSITRPNGRAPLPTLTRRSR